MQFRPFFLSVNGTMFALSQERHLFKMETTMTSNSSQTGSKGLMRRIGNALVEGRMREAQARVNDHLMALDDDTLKTLGHSRASLRRSRDLTYRY